MSGGAGGAPGSGSSDRLGPDGEASALTRGAAPEADGSAGASLARPASLRRSSSRWLLAASVASILALAGLVGFQFHLESETRAILDQRSEVARSIVRLRYFDEAMSMSARLFAAAGDRALERRHRALAPELDRELAKSLALVEDPAAERGLRAVGVANRVLVRTERRAFDLRRRGRRQAALDVFSDSRYLRAKGTYAANMDAALDRYTEASEAGLAAVSGRRLWSTILVLLATGVALACLAALAGLTTSYRKRERQAHEATRLAFERRRAERLLRESEERFRQVAGQAPMVLWAVDSEAVFTLSEGERLKSIGLRPGEVVGRSLFEVYADRPDLLSYVERALDGEEHSQLIELSGISFETQYLPIRGEDGEVTAVVGVSVDVTERVRAERERDRMERAALRDSLTGLGNHRAFHEDLARHLAARSAGDPPLGLVLVDVDGLKRINDTLGLQAGDERLRAVARAARGAGPPESSAYRLGGDEFGIVTDGLGEWASLGLVQRMQADLTVSAQPAPGASGGEIPTVTAGIAEAADHDTKDELVRRADLALIEAKRSHRGAIIWSQDLVEPSAGDADPALRLRHEQTLATALARAVDAKDSYTRSHCETVSEICALIARALGLEASRIDRLRLAGLLHDVGKIGIADAILQKPSPLTDEEFEVMKTHTALGHRILEGAELHREAAWVRAHHERLDGNGYPDGLAGDHLPLEPRVILVADAFEAITADRPYRLGRSDAEALEELERHSGTQFDAKCVAALRAALALAPPEARERHRSRPGAKVDGGPARRFERARATRASRV